MRVLPTSVDTRQECPPRTHTAHRMAGLQVPQHTAVQGLKQNWESGHHSLGLLRELMAQKMGRQELTEVRIILATNYCTNYSGKLCLAHSLQATP